MPYFDKSTGEKKFSLKEKVAYHNKCANSGVGADGKKLTTSQRINHVLGANRARKKLGKFARAKNMVNNKF